MSISQTNFPPGNRRLPDLQGSLPRPRLDSSSFREVLNKSVQGEANGSTNNTPPPSTAQLIDLANNIRMQMDIRLMSALSSSTGTEVSSTYTAILDQLFPPDSKLSNNSHSNQNHDVYKAPGGLENIIAETANACGIDSALVQSVIKVESNFNSNSTSPKGAMGLMQLMPETARELGVRNAYDPVENIRAGTRYLKMLLNRYDGDVHLALAAYNWGMGNLEKRPGQMPAETIQYVDKVTHHYEKLKA